MNAIAERRLSLFDIEAGWIPLLEARADAEDIQDTAERQAAIESADLALADHVGAEVQKVDGVIGFSRFLEGIITAAKSEVSRQQRRAQIAENVLKQVKANVLFAMQAGKSKRIDGTRGALTVKGNGGVAPLIITDESLLPDECCRVQGWMRADAWRKVMEGGLPPAGSFSFERVPDDGAIRAKLLEPCGRCDGGLVADGLAMKHCETCGGSGKQAVPGAYISERGSHVEIR
jgi:hypothetical protein